MKSPVQRQSPSRGDRAGTAQRPPRRRPRHHAGNAMPANRSRHGSSQKPSRCARAKSTNIRSAVTSSLGASILAWFKGGNTIVRVAVLILFIGVAFLLRYAAEHTTVPIEWRLAGVALCGFGLAALGLRLVAQATRLRPVAARCGRGHRLPVAVRRVSVVRAGAGWPDVCAARRVGRDHRAARREAERVAAGRARLRRRLPRAGARVHRSRQPCRTVQLLPGAQPRDRVDRATPELEAAEPDRLSCSRSRSAGCGARARTRRCISRAPSRSSSCTSFCTCTSRCSTRAGC